MSRWRRGLILAGLLMVLWPVPVYAQGGMAVFDFAVFGQAIQILQSSLRLVGLNIKDLASLANMSAVVEIAGQIAVVEDDIALIASQVKARNQWWREHTTNENIPCTVAKWRAWEYAAAGMGRQVALEAQTAQEVLERTLNLMHNVLTLTNQIATFVGSKSGLQVVAAAASVGAVETQKLQSLFAPVHTANMGQELIQHMRSLALPCLQQARLRDWGSMTYTRSAIRAVVTSTPTPRVFDLIMDGFMEVMKGKIAGLLPGSIWLWRTMVVVLFVIVLFKSAAADLSIKVIRFYEATLVATGAFAVLISFEFLAKRIADMAVFTGLMFGGNRLTLDEFYRPGSLMGKMFDTQLSLWAYIDGLSFISIGAVALFTALLLVLLASFCFCAVHIIVLMVKWFISLMWALIKLPTLLTAHTRFIGLSAIERALENAFSLGTVAFITSLIIPWVDATAWPLDQEPTAWGTVAAAGVAFLMAVLSFIGPSLVRMTGSAVIGSFMGTMAGFMRGLGRI